MNNPLRSYGHGIHAIDADYTAPLIAAVHLIEEDGRAALVDTAHNAAVPRVLAQMAALGLKPENVDYVLLTHVHLDHAGAAGAFMAAFPNARLVVHPRGARHMIDPSKLEAAVHEVYGREKAQALYGTLLPVAAERVIEAGDGLAISLAGRELRILDTPGHARHHVAYHDQRSGHVFTGDTFGLSYRQLDRDGRQFVLPTSSPSQFDAAALHATVDRIAALQPGALYLTHYGQVVDVPRQAEDMHRLIDAYAAIALREKNAGSERYARIKAGLEVLFREEAASRGWGLQGNELIDFLALDIDLNAQGLALWADGQTA